MKWVWTVAIVACLGALGVSIASYFELCQMSCSAQRLYRLFGWKFEVVGMVYFFLSALAIGAAYFVVQLRRWICYGMMAGVGAELVFLYQQKFVIGSWCPLCLAIAACVVIAAVSMLWVSGEALAHTPLPILLGLVVTVLGISRVDPLQAENSTWKGQLAVGSSDSNIELYLFTDWGCPACRDLEGRIESTLREIEDQVQLIFVDVIIHQESYNFIPFNISFLVNEKEKYLELRSILTAIAEETDTPSDELVNERVAKSGVRYQRMEYLDVVRAMKYFEKTADAFSVETTPTMIIYDKKTKASRTLVGREEIHPETIRKIISVYTL